MEFNPIDDGIEGERTVAVVPAPSPNVQADWSRQRFVDGRSVTAPALSGEQEHRAGRVRMLGQALRPGIVSGLETTLVEDAATVSTGERSERVPAPRFTVGPGLGICASGEDVVVPRAMTAFAMAMPVRLTSSLRFGSLTEGSEAPLGRVLSEWGRHGPLVPEAPRARIIPSLDRLSGVPSLSAATLRERAGTVAISAESAARLRTAVTAGTVGRGLSSSTISRELLSTNIPDLRPEVGEAVRAIDDALDRSLADTRIRHRYPLVAALVLEPVTIPRIGTAEGPTDDPCERDPESEPFQDLRDVDGARLAWYPLELMLDERDEEDTDLLSPEEWRARWLEGATAGHLHRNRVAWGIFTEEARRGQDRPLPWVKNAVPLMLVAFSSTGAVLWADRAAVARRGGRRLADDEVIEGRGSPALWQARVEQFNEQLADMVMAPGTFLASSFRWLPPAGVLPRELFDLDGRTVNLFPTTWGLSAAPVPLDQLDLVLRQAPGLAPYDLENVEGDELKLLVPVPSESWDPSLLRVETVHPDFHAARTEAEGRRDWLLSLRGELRAKIATLYAALGSIDAVPVFAADGEDTAAEEVVQAVLWMNAGAMGLFDTLGAKDTSPLFENGAALQDAAGKLLQTGASPDALSTALGSAVLQAFQLAGYSFAAGSRAGPIVVFPTRTDRSVETDLTATGGPGCEVPGGWTHGFMVNGASDRLALRSDPYLYIVLGELHTEALDRALAAAGNRPLVVLAAGLTEMCREEITWHHHRGHTVPLVCVIGREGDAMEDRVARLEDIAVLTGASNVSVETGAIAERHLPPIGVSHVVASSSRTTIINATRGSAAQLIARRNDLNTRLSTLSADDPDRIELNERLTALSGRAALIRLADPESGQNAARRVALAVDVLRRLTEVENPAEVDEMGLLLQAASQGVDSFGTVPTPGGPGVALVEDLVAVLAEMTTPPEDLRVIRDDDLRLVGELGVQGFKKLLQERIKAANDAVDFGFLQLQTVTFQLREMILGRAAALKMAGSPVLADIADLIQADTSPEQLAKFFDALREAADTGGEGGTGGTGGGGTVVPKPDWLDEAILYKNISRAEAAIISEEILVHEPLEDFFVASRGLDVSFRGGATDPSPEMRFLLEESTSSFTEETRTEGIESVHLVGRTSRDALAGAAIAGMIRNRRFGG